MEDKGQAGQPGKSASGLFDTSHLKHDLARRSISGGVAAITAQGAKFTLNFLSIVVLARLLSPGDFGLIAMVTPIVGLITLIRDMGLSAATIQKQSISDEQVSTLFWINVAMSAVLAGLIVASAPLVSRFYEDPRLIGITAIFGATMLTGGLSAQHIALLQRHMLFGQLAVIEVGSMLAGFAVAVVAALYGLSYWSLVLMTVTTSFVTMVWVWIACRWRPGRPVRGSGIRSMIAFGGHLTGANLCQYLNRNLDNILIGKVWGETALGLYNRAYSLLLLPITQLNGPITNVALPALSRLQNDPDRYRTYYRKALGLLVTAGMPLVVFISIEARPIIGFLLGQEWLGTVPIFQALAPAAFLGSFNVATGWLYVSLGRTARQLRWAILQTPIIAIGVTIGVQYGPIGVAAAYSAVMMVLRGPAIAFCLRGTFVRPRDVIGAVLPASVASIAAGACVLAVHAIPSTSFTIQQPFLAIMADAAIYLAFYMAIYCVTPGGQSNVRVMIDAARKLLRPMMRPANLPSPAAGE
ncbi:lipopolysaccharide biosynthesis protein [Microvirga pudoricolor]|uniref:lipopolysaccharide biosynthesis protein n=1 Tax=Microvirga pudoricolor TaxID=2778729 RepID=UPI00194EFBA5|nr:lipopolysaccharide biosynthesis protein [Microvirga pudoricolor]MBM6595654.1 lipopolysaccharide biosynthesis protein [Microvirga pudoricolor]